MIKLALIGSVLGFLSISLLDGIEGIIVAGFALIMTAAVISMLACEHEFTSRVQARRKQVSQSNEGSGDYIGRISDKVG